MSSMSRQLLVCVGILLCIVAISAQDAAAPAINSPSDLAAVSTPAPAPKKAAATTALAPPPPVVYAPKRTFGQWVIDLKHDPTLLIGFIVSLLSGLGFLFIVISVIHELVMGIPYTFKSSKAVQAPSPSSSMDMKMQTR